MRQAHAGRHAAQLDDLPDGAFVLEDGAAWLVLGDAFTAEPKTQMRRILTRKKKRKSPPAPPRLSPE